MPAHTANKKKGVLTSWGLFFIGDYLGLVSLGYECMPRSAEKR